MSSQNDLKVPRFRESARRIRRVQTQDIADEVWNTLEGFENPNYLRRSIRRPPGAALSAKQYRDASFALRQARYFFEAAERADVTVRPLVLYYGAVNFAKALGILFVPTTDRTDLSQHGLKLLRPVADLGKATVEVKEKGVARLLTESATYTDVQVFAFQWHEWTNANVLKVPTAAFPAIRGSQFSWGQLAARVPELRNYLSDVLKVRPHTFPGYIDLEQVATEPPRFRTRFVMRTGESDRPDPRTEKWVAAKLSARRRGWERFPTDGSQVSFMVLTSDPSEVELIPLYSSLNGDTHFAIPLGGGIPHEMVIHFLLLFLLGSIVRYEPSAWQRVVYERPELLGFVKRFMNLTLEKFAAMVLNRLTETCLFFVAPTEREMSLTDWAGSRSYPQIVD